MQCVPTYIVVSKVTTLKHEAGDDAVESRARVSEALLAGAQSAEVLGCLGDDVIEQFNDNPTCGFYRALVLVVIQGHCECIERTTANGSIEVYLGARHCD